MPVGFIPRSLGGNIDTLGITQRARPQTIDIMRETGTTALAIDATRTLLIDRDEILARADAAGIAIASYLPEE